MGIDISNYIEIFLEESNENLEQMNESLLKLEKEPGNKNLIDGLFRVAHTLKGMAATMGYTQMAELTHTMENVLELFRSGTLEADSTLITKLFSCLDMLSGMVSDVVEEGQMKSYDISSMQRELEQIGSLEGVGDCQGAPAVGADEVVSQSVPTAGDAAGLAAQAPVDEQAVCEELELNEYELTVLRQAKTRGYDGYHLTVNLDPRCLLKSARAYLVVNQLEAKGEIIKTLPTVEKIEEEQFEHSFQVIYVTKGSGVDVEATVMKVSEIDGVDVTPLNADSVKAVSEDAPIPEDREPDDSVLGLSETPDLMNPVKPAGKNVREAGCTADPAAGNGAGKAQLNQTIRVDLDRLNNIMNLVSELVIYRTRLEDMAGAHKAAELLEPLEQVARITSSLQDMVLKIRMQPIDLVFKRFPRMVRDLSRELGKEINLIIEGENTELDRTVVSELGEPLVHLIRNAVGHGIEEPADRRAAGKNPAGTVHLMAYQEGNKAVIKIIDDGQGLDPERLRQAAQRKGIDVAEMSDEDMQKMIFAQGFSTTEEVNSVSGRGVGMDVVKQKINQLGGTIELQSEVGKGTEFTVKLPLTLSIIQALLVNVGEETFAISLSFIEKVVSIQPRDIKMSSSGEVYVYTGRAIPVVRLRDALELESDQDDGNLIIVKVGGTLYGLAVSSLFGQQEIVIKPFGDILRSADQYIGATILGDGMVTLILDVGNICGE